jgi:ribosomal protein S18 acetylase RimI-like enzyme
LKDTRVAYVLSLGVVKEYRKNGIGRDIVASILLCLTALKPRIQISNLYPT